MADSDMEMHVILVGNPRDGYRVIGPFKTGDDADNYIDTEPNDVDWMTAMPLETPSSLDTVQPVTKELMSMINNRKA